MVLAVTAPARANGSVCEATATGLVCEGTQNSGALYRIVVPQPPLPWNGELIVYAHGFVSGMLR